MNTSLGLWGNNAQTHKRDGCTVLRRNPQSPYEFVAESLPPITGHAANSRNDSRPFSNAFGFFLFIRTTLCAFVAPPLSPGSAIQDRKSTRLNSSHQSTSRM